MKASRIALVIVTGVLLVSPTLADATPSGPAAGSIPVQADSDRRNPVLVQEEGRRHDPRVVGTSPPAPVVVAGPADRFDFTDAAIGAALGLSAALLALAALRMGQRIGRRAGALGA
jgi:hypothetical protein